MLVFAAACSGGPPPLDAAQVRSTVEAACADAASNSERLPPITDEKSLDDVFLDFSDVDGEPWRVLLDISAGDESADALESLVEGVRLIRVAPTSVLTAWGALDAEAVADVRADVEQGVVLLEQSGAALDTPSCTPEAWEIAFVHEVLTAAEEDIAAAAPTGVYRDDVNAACLRFYDGVGEQRDLASPSDRYLAISAIEAEAQELHSFLERLDPVADLRRVHQRLLDSAEELRVAAAALARAVTGTDRSAVERGIKRAREALDEVTAAFEALELPCLTQPTSGGSSQLAPSAVPSPSA